jgi:PKD repeat protein
MKKLLLSTTACLFLLHSINAQNKVPCATYQAQDIYLKNIPGYAEKLNEAKAASNAEYQAFLQKNKTVRTTSVQPTFTVPVVFHILHKGEATGTGSNINDQLCIDALAQVNKDYGKLGADTVDIDDLFKPLYKDANMHFMLAKKDPWGGCTNGIVHHYDLNTTWDQSTAFTNYIYSTTGNWEPSKYLNIYIVDQIVSSSSVVGGGIIVGYTHLPGTSPTTPADAIVYRNDFLYGLEARSLSHEIGHWFGLAHTFGDTNDPGFECGDDGILDTPQTTGFFSTCPAPINYSAPQSVAVLTDSSEVVNVTFGSVMSTTTALNSINGSLKVPALALTATSVTATSYTYNVVAGGSSVAGGYSDFSSVYPNDFNAGTTNVLTVKSVAAYNVNNYVGVYFDYNQNGSFADANETLLLSSASLFGTQTFSASVVLPSNLYGIYRMRVITSSTPITDPAMSLTGGEIEDYNFSIGTTPSPTTGVNKTMAACSETRPNVENIMDYSSCPKMFTSGQIDKMRVTCGSYTAGRNNLVSEANLYATGILTVKTLVTLTTTPTGTVAPTTYTAYAYSGPSTVTACAPIADFAQTKAVSCANQIVKFTDVSYNSTPTSYSWVFEGGSPSTSSLSVQNVVYSTPGNYSVSLTVSNSEGTSVKTLTNSVSVKWNSDQVLPYTETFESGIWWPTGMVIENYDLQSPSWVLSNYGSQGSSKCIVLPNANVSGFNGQFSDNEDALETPRFDFSKTTNLSISFDYSFARKTGVASDVFELQYTTDCGATWTKVLGSPTAGAMAASGGTVNAPYIPVKTTTTTTSPWTTKTIPSSLLTSLNNQRDVKFRFYFKNDPTGQSQNLYIDNINISGTVGLNEFENDLRLSIYPNPTNSSSTVEFISPSDSKIDVLVYDVTGRIVEINNVSSNSGANTKCTINASHKLNSGIYFVSIIIDNKKVTKKLIIE